MMGAMDEDFVTVARYRDPPMAELAKGKLLAEGIECQLQDDETIAINWLWSDVLGGVKVRVPEERAEEARLLLGAIEAEGEGAPTLTLVEPKSRPADELFCPLDTGPEVDPNALANAGRWLLVAAMGAVAVWMAAQP
jgi:hypothetical protein